MTSSTYKPAAGELSAGVAWRDIDEPRCHTAITVTIPSRPVKSPGFLV